MKKFLLSSLTLAVAFGTASAQTVFSGGPTDDIGLATNWNPQTLPSVSNVGTLNSQAEWAPANPTLTGFYLDIGPSGVLDRSAFFATQTIDGGVWNLNV